MKSNLLMWTALLITICYPISTSCHSRGEIFRGNPEQKGPQPVDLSRAGGYFLRKRNVQFQGQYQGQPQYPVDYRNPPLNNHGLYSVDTQAQIQYHYQNVNYNQARPSVKPEYYPGSSNQQSQNPQRDPSQGSNNFHNQHAKPLQQTQTIPAPTQRPNNRPHQTAPPQYQNDYYYNKVTTKQPSYTTTPFVESRFGDETSEVPFTSRPPKSTRKPPAPRKPPPPVEVPSRFDDRDSIKKMLSYDENASNAIEKFSLELLATFHLKLREQNFMISPFSIYHLLAMISEGARGDTYEELRQKLGYSSLEKARDFQQYLNVVLKKSTADVTLRKFAMLVVDKNRPPSPDFENKIEKVYEGDVEPVDFRDTNNALNLINDKISNYTEGQIIDTLMKEDLFKAQLILISGLFFKGSWMNVFNTTFTKREAFYDEQGNQIGDVNMMFQRGPLPYAAVAEIGCHVLELPYAEKFQTSQRTGQAEFGSGMSMIVVLPRKGLSLEEALRKVYEHGMIKIYKELFNAKNEYDDEEVEVHLPRFEIESSLDLKQTLIDFGVKRVFEESADLGNINPNYFISSMIHRTKMSVDEKGTTAAAVATAIFANKSTPPKFHANKPFLFFIVDKITNLILFSGQYAVPELY